MAAIFHFKLVNLSKTTVLDTAGRLEPLLHWKQLFKKNQRLVDQMDCWFTGGLLLEVQMSCKTEVSKLEEKKNLSIQPAFPAIHRSVICNNTFLYGFPFNNSVQLIYV